MRRPILNKILGAISIWGLLTLLLCSVAGANAVCEANFEPNPPVAKVRTYEASDSLSQYIRDNAPDYWRWSKQNAADYFKDLTKYEGIVVGDTHPGNFIYSPLAGRMKFFMMDVKDSGKGSFIVDIARLIMSTNAIFKEGKEDLDRSTERQLEAYIDGLRGKKFEPHDRIEWIFETTKSDFNDDLSDYVDKKTVGSRFKLKDGMIEPLEDYVTNHEERKRIKEDIRKAVAEQIKGSEVLDYAYRPRERGGSKNLRRFWVLVQARGEKQILEIKQIEPPAVAQYEPQLPAIERFPLVMKTLWGVEDPLYKAILVDGEPYWMRPKKVDVFDIPYKQKDKDARKFLRHLAAYEAHLVGLYHGKQLRNKEFADALENKFDKVVKHINEMSDDYTGRLSEKVEELQSKEKFN